nr:MAG TPA: hypothetical protein [Caudoviricetes sp.]
MIFINTILRRIPEYSVFFYVLLNINENIA